MVTLAHCPHPLRMTGRTEEVHFLILTTKKGKLAGKPWQETRFLIIIITLCFCFLGAEGQSLVLKHTGRKT